MQPALSTFAERVKHDAAEVQSNVHHPFDPQNLSSKSCVSQRSGSIHSRGQANNDKYSLKSGSRRQHTPSIGTPRRGQSAAADAHAEGIIEKVKAAIIRRGGSHGIHAMSRVLKIMDDNGNKVLSREELKYGLRDYGIDLSNKQLDAVMSYFDRNGDGTVDIDEFYLEWRHQWIRED